MAWSQDAIIVAALPLYRQMNAGDYRSPIPVDTLKNNRNSPEVDATSDAPGFPSLAIEHTRVESFAGQIMDDARIVKYCSSLEQTLAPLLPKGTACTIPTGAFVIGFDWQRSMSAIRAHMPTIVEQAPAGLSQPNIPGVPFKVTLKIDRESPNPFRLAREAPPRSRIAKDLLASVAKALAHKKNRLAWYRTNGFRTVLIIENLDPSLVDHIEIYKAFLRAEGGVATDHLDDILLAQTMNPQSIDWLTFKSATPSFFGLNPLHFLLGPTHRKYWDAALKEDEQRAT